MNFTSAMAARDVAFTKLTTTTRNLSIQLRHQEDHIQALQAELCNLEVVESMQTNAVKLNNTGGQPYACDKNHKWQWPTDPTEKNIATKITDGPRIMIQLTHTHWRHA